MPSLPASYEAESRANVLDGGARVASMDGASGGAGVYAIGAPNTGTLRFTGIGVPTAGWYLLTVYYQNPDESGRGGEVTVNDNERFMLFYPSTGGCCVLTTLMWVNLNAGSGNTITFGYPVDRAADIDRIVVSTG
jgi:hypothetical protein